jgi:hypothetical protein
VGRGFVEAWGHRVIRDKGRDCIARDHYARSDGQVRKTIVADQGAELVCRYAQAFGRFCDCHQQGTLI